MHKIGYGFCFDFFFTTMILVAEVKKISLSNLIAEEEFLIQTKNAIFELKPENSIKNQSK